jgi:uncharacterized protein YidB (DUF937 family)
MLRQELQLPTGETIMGLLDGLLGGVVGAEVVTVVNSLIQQHGGVQGIVTQLEQQGLGNTVRSWIATGPNQPISPDQLNQAFGGVIGQLAAKTGMSPQELTAKLAHALPAAIDHLTPSGSLPAKPV